jgi:hypothetical protein
MVDFKSAVAVYLLGIGDFKSPSTVLLVAIFLLRDIGIRIEKYNTWPENCACTTAVMQCTANES